MPNYTQNYNLEKPTEDEFYDVGVQNGNMDKLDETIASIDTAKAAAKNTIADGDSVSIVDSTDSSKTKRVLWSTIKSAMGQIFVPLTRKVNNKDLSADISLTGDDIATSATDGATVSSQLSNLESALTTPPQKFDLPLLDGWYTNDRAQYRKTQEGLAVVNAILELSEGYDASDNTQIAVLPEGFRPATSFMYPVSVQDGSTRASAIVQIGTSGTIIYYGASNTTAVFRIYLNAAFFAAS